jgi:hypothetical protein
MARAFGRLGSGRTRNRAETPEACPRDAPALSPTETQESAASATTSPGPLGAVSIGFTGPCLWAKIFRPPMT